MFRSWRKNRRASRSPKRSKVHRRFRGTENYVTAICSHFVLFDEDGKHTVVEAKDDTRLELVTPGDDEHTVRHNGQHYKVKAKDVRLCTELTDENKTSRNRDEQKKPKPPSKNRSPKGQKAQTKGQKALKKGKTARTDRDTGGKGKHTLGKTPKEWMEFLDRVGEEPNEAGILAFDCEFIQDLYSDTEIVVQIGWVHMKFNETGGMFIDDSWEGWIIPDNLTDIMKNHSNYDLKEEFTHLTPDNIESVLGTGVDITTVRSELTTRMDENPILVGHNIAKDAEVLGLKLPNRCIDTADNTKYEVFTSEGQAQKLRHLVIGYRIIESFKDEQGKSIKVDWRTFQTDAHPPRIDALAPICVVQKAILGKEFESVSGTFDAPFNSRSHIRYVQKAYNAKFDDESAYTCARTPEFEDYLNRVKQVRRTPSEPPGDGPSLIEGAGPLKQSDEQFEVKIIKQKKKKNQNAPKSTAAYEYIAYTVPANTSIYNSKNWRVKWSQELKD